MDQSLSSDQPTIMGLSFFPQQWKAVSAPLGPHLILAGPGAGKTRCLTGRIAYLIEQEQVDPENICAITFTNKAAQEIATRLKTGIGPLVEHLTLGTIHSLCLQILRRYAHRVGLPSNFAVASDEHQKLVLSKLGVESRYHSRLLLSFGKKRLQGETLHHNDEEVFKRYHREIRSNHLIDYDEILQLTFLLLESSTRVLTECQERWQHILIDEVQDLDETQYRIIKLLASSHRNLFAVGDDEQSIFAWRGADPKVIATLVSDFEISPIVLDINCRCGQAIFEMAQKILPTRELGIEKKIKAVHASSHPIRVFECADEDEEIERVVQDLQRELKEPGLPRGEVAILYRTHLAGRRWEQALIQAGIPCLLAKGQAISDDAVIAQILASLRVVIHPDSELHLEHLASKVFDEPLMAEVRRAPGETFSDKLRTFVDENMGGAARKVCWRFLYQVENLKSLRNLHGNLQDLIQAIFAQGFGQMENRLEPCHEDLLDPLELAEAREIGNLILETLEASGRALITPAGGLEIPVKIMLARALPDLKTEYLTSEIQSESMDLILALQPIPFSPSARIVSLHRDRQRLRITQLFKALQYIESRNYRQLFDEYVTFDTETTGKDVDECDVIELAATKVKNGLVVDTFHSLVWTEKPISPGATEVHGYSNKDLEGMPTLQEIWPRFRKMVEGHVMIAHNGHRFDVPILKRQTAPWNGMDNLLLFDTLALARTLFPHESLRQENLALRFGIDAGRSHHALDDAQCLADVFERLQQERLIRARKTCLDTLLDCLTLGAAIENRAVTHPEDQTLLQAGEWKKLHRFTNIVDSYAEEAEKRGDNVPALEVLIERMGGESEWPGASNAESQVERRSGEARSRLSHLVETIQGETIQECVQQLLDKVTLSTSEGPGTSRDRVSLLTFHATKGLEFSRLYIVGVEDNQFPGYRALEEQQEEVIREHRRLFYVAMTRARDKLTMTRCRERNGRPTGRTLFLDEIGVTPEQRLRLETESTETFQQRRSFF